MNVSTLNVVVAGMLSIFGGMMLFALGVIVTYVRSINKSQKELLVMAIESKTRMDLVEKQIEDIYAKINR